MIPLETAAKMKVAAYVGLSVFALGMAVGIGVQRDRFSWPFRLEGRVGAPPDARWLGRPQASGKLASSSGHSLGSGASLGQFAQFTGRWEDL
ncbi:MAG: hypothetical protein HY925_01990, partial [Elusimicrobia bacterium]|nr:hypothetical protein [Elusimicrobiota bacterium]